MHDFISCESDDIDKHQMKTINFRQNFYINSLNQSKLKNKDFPYRPQNQDIKQKKFQYLNNYNELNKEQSQNKKELTQNCQIFQIEKKRKKQRYLRSTNNSHKKFITCLKRLFFSVIKNQQKQKFQQKYQEFQSCRTYFFIILAYMKFRFSIKLIRSVRHSFLTEMNLKIQEYQIESQKTKNLNLKNFRKEQIIDIRYSMLSFQEYFKRNAQVAIQIMYKKDKQLIIKRRHYQVALKQIQRIQGELRATQTNIIEQQYIQKVFQEKDFSNKIQEIKEQMTGKIQIKNQQVKLKQQRLQNQQKMIKNDSNHQKNNITEKKATKFEDISGLSTDKNKSIMNFLYPPLLQPIPYIKYSPFLSPFTYNKLSSNHNKYNHFINQFKN